MPKERKEDGDNDAKQRDNDGPAHHKAPAGLVLLLPDAVLLIRQCVNEFLFVQYRHDFVAPVPVRAGQASPDVPHPHFTDLGQGESGARIEIGLGPKNIAQAVGSNGR